MKKSNGIFLISFLFIFFSTTISVVSQNKNIDYDRVDIYIVPGYISILWQDECSQNENWVRVNYKIKISIKEVNEITRIHSLILDTSSQIIDDYIGFNAYCVIDFIVKGSIKQSVVFDSTGNYYINSVSTVYRAKDEMLKFVRNFTELQVF